MSYDLYFCRKSGVRPTNDEVSQVCRTSGFFQKPEDAPEGFWLYENEATGVYFTLEREAFASEDDEGPRSIIPGGHVDAELHFILNFARPSFFGIEAMSVVADLCNSLGLLVLDPQADWQGQPVNAEPPDKEKLAQRWRDHNSLATKALASSGEATINHWSHTRAFEWFRYQFTREKTEQELDNQKLDVFVPNLMLVVQKGHPKLIKTMLVWNDSIPFVFPECDLVAILRKRKSFLRGTIEERGILPADFVRNELRDLLQPLTIPTGQTDYLSEPSAAQARTRVAKWKLDAPFESIERVSPDSFVDDLP